MTSPVGDSACQLSPSLSCRIIESLNTAGPRHYQLECSCESVLQHSPSRLEAQAVAVHVFFHKQRSKPKFEIMQGFLPARKGANPNFQTLYNELAYFNHLFLFVYQSFSFDLSEFPKYAGLGSCKD
jgi:hypothetical protein